jgi:hypothetical protein
MPNSFVASIRAIGESAKSNPVTSAFLALWVVLAVVSFVFPHLPSPAPWLEAWTKWIAAAVGVVVSARVLWSGAAALQKFADRR